MQEARMSWNQRTFEPSRQPVQDLDQLRSVSLPLSRFFFMVASTVGGFLAFYGGTTLLGLGSDFLRAEGAWGWKEILVLGASLVAVLFCGLLGLTAGARIKVCSERSHHVLSVLWHYLANGSLIWLVLLSLTLSKALGQTEAKALLARLGVGYSMLALLGTGVAGSLAVAILLLGAGQLNPGTKPKFLVCLLLSWPVAAALGFLQFRLLGVITTLWLLPSAVFPLILIPTAAMMMARDDRQRRDLLARGSN
jgi:hypothetical protein